MSLAVDQTRTSKYDAGLFDEIQPHEHAPSKPRTGDPSDSVTRTAPADDPHTESKAPRGYDIDDAAPHEKTTSNPASLDAKSPHAPSHHEAPADSDAQHAVSRGHHPSASDYGFPDQDGHTKHHHSHGKHHHGHAHHQDHDSHHHGHKHHESHHHGHHSHHDADASHGQTHSSHDSPRNAAGDSSHASSRGQSAHTDPGAGSGVSHSAGGTPQHTPVTTTAPTTRGTVQSEKGSSGTSGMKGTTGRSGTPGTPATSRTTGTPAAGGTTGNFDRQTLASNHGWGAQNGGVTGGSAADNAHVYTVTNRDQLIAALGGNNATNGGNNTSKIIRIEGTIDMNADSNGNQMTKAQFGNENAQLQHDMANVGSNTTIIGEGSNAKIINGGLNLNNAHNDIVRNIDFQSPNDFFPGKDAEGNPHGRVYSIEAKGTTNLWVDHNTFSDGGKTPAGSITGDQLDFTDGADYATVSNNQFLNHNKSMLIGSSDGMTSDAGKLHVTIDHNEFAGTSQRDPRVRYGQVEVANNLYEASASQQNPYQYSLGVGKDSNITSQNNDFVLSGVDSSKLVKTFDSSGHLTDSGSLANGQAVSLSVSPTGKGPGAGGVALDPTADVQAIVTADAGAGKIGKGD